ncbi:acyltransferase family protein [Pseudonocardia sp.]|uniref:acyltransferase family protein n=1 Tax=Pseudonocardia sp. TaxID=60912 RepID=UPI003D0CB918
MGESAVQAPVYRHGVPAEHGTVARRDHALDGVRGLAVLLVFCVHYHTIFSAWITEDSATGTVSYVLWIVGGMGVDLFFVLSGYLIHGAVLAPTARYATFIRRRARRLLPAFLAVLGVHLAIPLFLPDEYKLPADGVAAAGHLVANVLLLPGLFPIEPIVPVAWTLSYELAFYLALPLLVLGLGMRRWPARRRVLLFAVLAAVGAIAVLALRPGCAQLLLFVGGVLARELTQLGSWRPGRGTERLALAVLVATFPLVYVLAAPPAWTPAWNTVDAWGDASIPVVLVVLLGGVAAVLVRATGPMRRVFEWPPLGRLGEISYSYYLVHALTLKFFALAVAGIAVPTGMEPALFWLVLPTAFAVTMATSALLFVVVERPLSLTHRRAAQPPASAGAGSVDGSSTSSPSPAGSKPAAR